MNQQDDTDALRELVQKLEVRVKKLTEALQKISDQTNGPCCEIGERIALKALEEP